MWDDGVAPVGVGGAGAAVGFEVVGADFAAGELRAADDEPVGLAGEGDFGAGGKREHFEKEDEHGEESRFHMTRR